MLIATMTYSTKHQEGRSALSLAAERGDVDVMKVLLDRGVDVIVQDEVIMCGSLHKIACIILFSVMKFLFYQLARP